MTLDQADDLEARIEEAIKINAPEDVEIPAPEPTSIDELLDQRGKTHGDFAVHAMVTQDLKEVMRSVHKVNIGSDTVIQAWSHLIPSQRESLDMIVHKIGRILAGDPDFRDHWDDIAGYAKLSADRCSK